MKKLIATVLVLGVLGGGGWLAYRYLFVPKERRACERLAELCSSDTTAAPARVARCEQALERLKKVTGEPAVARAADCVTEAQGCAAAAGCVFGAGIGAMGEFLKGAKDALDRSLQQK